MASLGTSFSTSGALPKPTSGMMNSSTPAYSQALSPQGKALNSALSGGAIRTSPAPSLTAPNQSVKSHTITNTDGSTVSQTYHPAGQNGMSPGNASAPSQQPNYDTHTGLLTPAGKSAGLSEVNAPKQEPQASTPQSPEAAPVTFPGLVSQLAQNSSKASPEYTEATDRTRKAYDEAAKTNQIIARSESDALHNPNYSLDTGIGRAGQIAQNYGQIGQNALTRAAGESTLVGAANTQQGTRQSGLVSAVGAAAPQAYGLLNQPYNPLTDTYGGGGATGATDRAIQAGNINTAQDFTQQYNEGKAKLNAAKGIESQIVGTLNANPSLNSTPVSAFTNLNELISGQISSGPQQLLSQQIAQYISTLGLDPATITRIASQERGTLGDLLGSLKKTAEAQVESKNPANLKGGSSSSSSSGGTANPWH